MRLGCTSDHISAIAKRSTIYSTTTTCTTCLFSLVSYTEYICTKLLVHSLCNKLLFFFSNTKHNAHTAVDYKHKVLILRWMPLNSQLEGVASQADLHSGELVRQRAPTMSALEGSVDVSPASTTEHGTPCGRRRAAAARATAQTTGAHLMRRVRAVATRRATPLCCDNRRETDGADRTGGRTEAERARLRI